MEKPLRPAFIFYVYSEHLKKDVVSYALVPDKILPMDLYNALSRTVRIDIHYSWITTRGKIVSGEEAALLAEEANLLDRKVKSLTVEDFPGTWRR